MDTTVEPKPLDLRAYARILWRRKWIFLAVLVVLPVAVYIVSSRSAKMYQSSTLIEVQPTTIDAAQGANQGGPTAQFIAIAARLIQTTGVADAAAHQLPGQPSSPSQLLRAISVSTDPTTGFITITAQADSPARAAEVANAFGAAINSARAQGAVVQLDRQIVSIKAQVKALPKTAVTPRNQLISQLERLRAQRAAQGANAQIIEPATAKASPISPRPARNTLLALIVAILLGLGAVALVENLDRRIRRPEELEELVGIPLLSSVPKSAFGGTDTPSSIEGFRTLRANLTFFNVDRDINSIVIASARQDEGKSIVAVGLAKAFAMSGSDVILIDADLRRPTLATRLKLDAAAGLAGVLVGKCEVGDCLVDHEVRGRDAGRLRVLPAGETPPNPGELLGSQRMHRLIEELSTMSDLLVIDTSPLMAVSDALPLLDEVPGTLLVARLGVVHRDDLRYLKKVLGSARASVLGVVATGVSERAAYPYVSAAYIDQPEPAVSSNGDTQKSRGPLAALGRRRR